MFHQGAHRTGEGRWGHTCWTEPPPPPLHLPLSFTSRPGRGLGVQVQWADISQVLTGSAQGWQGGVLAGSTEGIDSGDPSPGVLEKSLSSGPSHPFADEVAELDRPALSILSLSPRCGWGRPHTAQTLPNVGWETRVWPRRLRATGVSLPRMLTSGCSRQSHSPTLRGQSGAQSLSCRVASSGSWSCFPGPDLP